MSVFLLDTDSVTGVGSSVNSLASNVENIASNVSSYDTNCSDGFDFNGAKNVISENIKACAIKIKNTNTVIERVCSTHTKLQNYLVNGEEVDNSASYTYASGYSGGYSGGYSSAAGVSQVAASQGAVESSTQVEETSKSVEENNESVEDVNKNAEEVEEDVETTPYTEFDSNYDDELDSYTPKYEDEVKSIEVNDSVNTVSCGQVDLETLSDEGRMIFDSLDFAYDEAGFAVLGGLYVICCAESIGKVDDLVRIQLKDGTVIDCIVGENDNELEGIKFFVNEDYDQEDVENVSSLVDGNIESISNHGKDSAQTKLLLSDLPEVGEYTSTLEVLDDEWTIVDTEISLEDYQKIIEESKIFQDSDAEKYKDSCLGFSYLHASNLYNGVDGDLATDAGEFKHGDEFISYYSDSKEDILSVIYSQIVRGKPVIMQVNGDKEGKNRHFVTVVGFRNGITSSSKLTEKDLLIIDPWDGKLERMDQEDSRFMTTGADSEQSYSGYYLRLLSNE